MPTQDRVAELFTDARQVQSQAVERLETGNIRDAADKAWCAIRLPENRRQRPRHHTLQVGAGPSDRGNGAADLQRPPAGRQGTQQHGTTERGRHPVADGSGSPVDRRSGAAHPEQRGLLRNHLGQGTSYGERRLPGQGAQRFPCDHLPGRV